MTTRSAAERPHVVIVGGGFGGLTTAKALAKAPVRITLIDRKNHHLFQPLLYQVAMAGLSPADIASPIRSILSGQENLSQVLLAEVTGFDFEKRQVLVHDSGDHSIEYDYLVLAVGAETNYFGHDEWAETAPGLKDLDDAVEIRRRVLLAFEEAEREPDDARRRELMTFVVIGGGPTGVELAGSLIELGRFVLARDFERISPQSARVLLVEAGPKVLGTFGDELAAKAVEQLEGLGVEVLTGRPVTDITPEGVRIDDEFIRARTVVWGAGVRATTLNGRLGVPVDRAGRVLVEPDCSLPGRAEVFAIGDMAAFLHQDGKPLPGVSPVAMQQARSVAKNIVRSIAGRPREKFVYDDRGTMATIGRRRAIAVIRGWKLSGRPAWLAWLLIHLVFLIGFRNRFSVLLNWAWSYVTYQRGARLITGPRLEAGPPRREPAAGAERVPVGAGTGGFDQSQPSR
jgi:NADH:ubiquinone reductase (H+-translocating)